MSTSTVWRPTGPPWDTVTPTWAITRAGCTATGTAIIPAVGAGGAAMDTRPMDTGAAMAAWAMVAWATVAWVMAAWAGGSGPAWGWVWGWAWDMASPRGCSGRCSITGVTRVIPTRITAVTEPESVPALSPRS